MTNEMKSDRELKTGAKCYLTIQKFSTILLFHPTFVLIDVIWALFLILNNLFENSGWGLIGNSISVHVRDAVVTRVIHRKIRMIHALRILVYVMSFEQPG